MYKSYNDHGYADYQSYMQIPDATVASLTALEGSDATDNNNKRFAQLVYNVGSSSGGTGGSAADSAALSSIDSKTIPIVSSLSGTLGVGAVGTSLETKGGEGVGLAISGTWTGSLIVEESTNNGVAWATVSTSPLQGGARSQTITTNGQYEGMASGVTHVRVSAAGVLTGSVNYSLIVTRGSRIQRIWSTDFANVLVTSTLSQSGSAVTSTNPVPVGVEGVDINGVRRNILTGIDGKVVVGNTKDIFRDPFVIKDNTKWNYPTETGTQYARSRVDGNVAGASYLDVTMSALSAGGDEWSMTSVQTFKPPYEIEYGMQLSQRIFGQDFSVEMVGCDTSGNIISNSAIPPVQLYSNATVATNVWTLNTLTAHNLLPGDFVYIYGATDPRLNVGPVVVTAIASTYGITNQLTIGSTLSNGSYILGSNAYIQRVCPAGLAQYQASTRWYSATAGNCDTVSVNADARPRTVNWNVGNTQDTSTVISEGGVNYASLNYVQAFRSKGTWHFEHSTKRLLWRSRDIDSSSSDRSTSYRKIPNPIHDLDYKVRIRCANYKNMSVPVNSVGNTVLYKKGATVATLGTPTGGSLYTNGKYFHVPVTGGTGTGATLNITVTGNVVSAVTVAFGGTGYTAADVLTCSNTLIGGTGSGWQVAVATVTASSTNALVTCPNHGLQIADGCLSVLGAITAGSGYVDGVYVDVPLTGGTGTGATAKITVSGGAVTTVQIILAGKNYTAADSLSCSNTYLGGSGSSFAVAVTTVIASTDYVVIYGGRDATNWANVTSATAVAAVIDANTYGIAYGATATVLTTSYGGFTMKVQGGIIPTIQTMAVQSYAKTLDGQRLSIVGSATWTQTIGNTVTLFGLIDSSNNPITALYGRYRVAYLATSTLELEPLDGQSLSGVTTTAINAGGALILNTSFRLDYFRLFDRVRNEVDITNAGSTLQGDGLPVNVTNSLSVGTVTTVSTVTSLSQIAASVPLMAVANGSTNKALGISMCTALANTDHSAVAFAGSGRVAGTVVSSATGGGTSCSFDISVTVTTLGTATALLFVLQESYDSGTTWSDIWVTHPVTTTQHIRVPALPINGRRRWAMHSVGGTSTTVPATIVAQELPGVVVQQRQYVDIYAATNPMQSIINGTTVSSTLVSTTLNSTSGVAIVEGCKNITIAGVFTGGTPTTNPTYSLQISQDATNWYTTTTNITPTAAGTFMASIQGICARFARLIVTTASAGGTPYGVTYTSINGVN